VLGTHLIDIMRWMMVPTCGEVIDIKSFVKNNKLYNHTDETILTIMKFESGATAEIFCSVAFDSPLTLEIYATQKNVLGLDLLEQNDRRRIFVNGEPIFFEKTSPYIDELNDFVDAINNKRPPEVSLFEGLRNIEHLIAIENQRTR
jgi:predicted dehydrogenase